ncbi:hypothetical protein K5V21_15595 [Clostridium sardiniense]|uniref:Uncharacterized protein n=1 Tax=Clostridium sardiniense TaxID=29369 RepID=A0ABS7L1C4_CLOSR|nr:hypothetical protein [Clostridium sardiniense]MBY0756868.1 hypothetical protein [Clostridium sardiniense]MDQ0458713.1 hypothetical protein [Clostridium sardiniense]
MYNPSNFLISINNDSIINLTTGGTISVLTTVSNTDSTSTLYNLSFTLNLGDGITFVSSSVPYTSVSDNIYLFTNIKDLAPNEIDYGINFNLKLNTEFNNGDTMPFGSLISCSITAFADTMPRGIYDNNNEIIESISTFSFNASRYIIYKVNPSKLLLGKIYSSSIIIKTAKNSDIFFDSFTDILGNGINYLGNLSILGYSSQELNNFTILSPNTLSNNFSLVWNNVSIPEDTTVTIRFDIKINERYYTNGTILGSYIENNSSISNELSWVIDNVSFSQVYTLIAFEVILNIVLSKYIVDINEELTYYVYFYNNLYHGLLNLSGYLTTSDGQILDDTSTPMYTSKTTSSGGITQVLFNVGTISAGQTAIVKINGSILNKYLSNGLDILSGDTFTVSTNCNAISTATNKLISSSDSTVLRIGFPLTSKVITGYYYRDNTPKPFNIVAPGDYISYKSTYNSSNILAPSSQVKIFDFYPYMTKDILNINYNYSSNEYPGTGIVPVSPNGVLWFVNSISGGQSFDIDYTTQIDYINSDTNFPYNLFKLQVVNSNGIGYSSRSQVGFIFGKPNLILNRNVFGNNINKVKIGEIYSFNASLKNDNSLNNVTDAFNITFTESIPSSVILDQNSIIAKVNDAIVPFTIQNNSIVINIDKLGPNDIFMLSYKISISNTLGPNESFTFTSSTTSPYTQSYNSTLENLQYDIGALTQSTTLRSEVITLQLNSDSPTKIVGDIVYYTLKITIPMGQKLSSLSNLILIPSYQTYLNEAWLNDVPIDSSLANRTVIFDTITNIDTISSSIIYNYKIKCLISDSIVSSQNPLYTTESFYGNLTYINMLNETTNLGINNSLIINHPHIDLNIGSSGVMNGFTQFFILGSFNKIYTKVQASNLGNTDAANIYANVSIPDYLNFNNIILSSNGVTSSYNSITHILSINIDYISALSNKYLVFESNILNGPIAENKLIITGHANQYYNKIYTSKIYTSDLIYNNELYINSLIQFLPLSFYSLIGSDAAINLSQLGEPTKIEYILTNIGQGFDSYRLEMTPIKYDYDVYIGETFVQSIPQNTSANITSSLLNNIAHGNSIYISFRYIISVDSGIPFYATMLVKATSINNENTKKTIPTTLQDP